jgi:O-antigen ligase
MLEAARRGAALGSLGVTGALATLGAGIAATPLAAIAVPISALMGLSIVVYPFLGLALLVVFSHLDGLSNVIFAFSPVSGFKLLTALTATGILLTVAMNRAQVHRSLQDPVLIMAVLFFVTMCVSGLFAENRGYALDSIRRMGSLVVFLAMCVLLVDRRSRLTMVFYIFIGTSLFSAMILILDIMLGTTLLTSTDAATTARTAEGFDRSSGASEHNPTTAATMLLTGVVMALVAFLEGGRHRTFLLTATLVGSLAIVLTFARSSALVYGIVAVLLAWRYRKSRYMPLGMTLGFLILLAMTPFIPPSYWERIGSIFGGSGGDWTLGRRLTYNLIGLELAVRNPILGVGPGNFREWFVNPEFRYMPGRTLLGRQLHNMYLSVIVEYGIVGATFFFGFLAHSLRSVYRAMRNPVDNQMRVMATAYFYGFVAYLMVSIFVPNEYNKYTWMLAGVATAFAYLNRPQAPEDNGTQARPAWRAALRSGQ